jgi:hypothetical protein
MISLDYKPREGPNTLATCLPVLEGLAHSILAVHPDRSDEVLASGKYFMHSFGEADENMDVARRHECPD